MEGAGTKKWFNMKLDIMRRKKLFPQLLFKVCVVNRYK
jgi:hypothetical protein